MWLPDFGVQSLTCSACTWFDKTLALEELSQIIAWSLMCCLRRGKQQTTANRCVIGRQRWKTHWSSTLTVSVEAGMFSPSVSLSMLMGCEAHCNALHMIIVATNKCVAPVALTQFTLLSHSTMTPDDLPPGCLFFCLSGFASVSQSVSCLLMSKSVSPYLPVCLITSLSPGYLSVSSFRRALTTGCIVAMCAPLSIPKLNTFWYNIDTNN